MSDEKVGGLPDPAAILYPDSGFRRDDHAKALWRTHGYDTGGEPFYSADQLHSHAAARVHAALSAHGQPVDYSPALHSVLSYIAYGECDEEGLHPGLFATVKEKIDKLRSKPVVDKAMAQKFWDGYEQYFVDLSADELFDGKDRKIEAAMSALTAALTGAAT